MVVAAAMMVPATTMIMLMMVLMFPMFVATTATAIAAVASSFAAHAVDHGLYFLVRSLASFYNMPLKIEYFAS